MNIIKIMVILAKPFLLNKWIGHVMSIERRLFFYYFYQRIWKDKWFKPHFLVSIYMNTLIDFKLKILIAIFEEISLILNRLYLVQNIWILIDARCQMPERPLFYSRFMLKIDVNWNHNFTFQVFDPWNDMYH